MMVWHPNGLYSVTCGSLTNPQVDGPYGSNLSG